MHVTGSAVQSCLKLQPLGNVMDDTLLNVVAGITRTTHIVYIMPPLGDIMYTMCVICHIIQLASPSDN